MGLFRNYRAYAHDIEYVQGTDAKRMVSYRVYALGGFFLEGVVAWVQEEGLRSGKQVEFWVLTSLDKMASSISDSLPRDEKQENVASCLSPQQPSWRPLLR